MTTVLLLIDFQNDYFPDGRRELERADRAVSNAAELLNAFRERGLPVVHIRHEFPGADAPFFQPGSEGAKTHQLVAPRINEPVVLKHEINGFQGTKLKEVLDSCRAERLVICGAMTHMCIDGTTRAAHDLGYECVVVNDACATHAMEFEGVAVSADQVHAAFMHALGFAYSKVASTAQALMAISRPPMQTENA